MPQTKTTQCEVCDLPDMACTLHYGNVWYCDSCWAKEVESTKIHMSPEAQQARVDAYNARVNADLAARAGNQAIIPINTVLKESREIDSAIQVRTDLFNAATKTINELKAAIDADENITNKPYALAEVLKERFDHFKAVVFETNQILVDASNNQRAIQTYLNTLANQLRAEERERLKIADINYKPAPPKTPKEKKIGTTSTKKKLDKAALKKYAMELGIAEFTLQALCVSQGISAEDAYKKVKASLDAAKAG